MKTCSNPCCSGPRFSSSGNYCDRCGSRLVDPFEEAKKNKPLMPGQVRCVCGEINYWSPGLRSYCPKCGLAISKY